MTPLQIFNLLRASIHNFTWTVFLHLFCNVDTCGGEIVQCWIVRPIFISFSYVLHAFKLTTTLCNQHLTYVVLTGVCLLIRAKHAWYPLKQRNFPPQTVYLAWLEHRNTHILTNLLDEYDGPQATCPIAIELVLNFGVLAPGICMNFLRLVIFKLFFVIGGWDLARNITRSHWVSLMISQHWSR